MFKVRKVTGGSMLPVLRHGDYVFLLKWRIKKGDIVVVNHPHFGDIIKRVKSIENAKITLSGDNSSSVNSDQIGEVSYENLLGKVLFKL